MVYQCTSLQISKHFPTEVLWRIKLFYIELDQFVKGLFIDTNKSFYNFFLFFHWLRLNWLLMATLILSYITLLIRPISFLAGLISLILFGLFSKFSFWSFIVMKQLLSPLICSLFTRSLSFKIRLPLMILSFIHSQEQNRTY